MSENKFYTSEGRWLGTRIMARNEYGHQHLTEDGAVNLLNDYQKENARLRAALEKFADEKDWAIIVLESGLRYEACYKFRGDQKADPWQIAQEALKGREGDDD